MAQGGPALAQQRVGAFPDGAHAADQRVVGPAVDFGVEALDRGVHPDPGALVALVGRKPAQGAADTRRCVGATLRRSGQAERT